jgi:hypothetical protein
MLPSMSATEGMHERDRAVLERARRLLEQPTLAARLAARLGMPLERSARLLPARAREALAELTRHAIERALQVALKSLALVPWRRAPRVWPRLAAGAVGAVGGFFGLPALAVELPASTVLILRAIAEIARAHGEDLDDPEVRLACVEVFALSGFATRDDATDASYYGARAALAGAVSEAVRHVAHEGAAESAPVLVRLVTAVAARFGLVVTDKALLTALPVVGAAGGAVVNALFVEHFQRVAEGHFAVRGLERRYGTALVQQAYEELGARR